MLKNITNKKVAEKKAYIIKPSFLKKIAIREQHNKKFNFPETNLTKHSLEPAIRPGI